MHYSCIGLLLTGTLTLSTLSAEESINIKTSTLEQIALYPERSAPATVESLNEATISAQINAHVALIPVRVGDLVAAGGLLTRLDCSDYDLAVQSVRARKEATQARILLAERRVMRTQSLLEKQSTSEEALDERQADLAVLRADLKGVEADEKAALLNQSRCQVVSPFQALVTERVRAEGDYASVGQGLVRIIDLAQREVSAQVFTQDVRHLELVERIYFEQAEQRYPLKLRRILPAINSQTRNQEVRLEFTQEQALPGAAGKLVWRDVRPHVPAHLLVRREGQLGVFILEQGQARFVAAPGAQAGRASPIDLPALTPLIVEGHLGLQDSDRVAANQS